jgi:hypothetical protein
MGEQEATATGPEPNPVGLLFISDVQALRRAESVCLHASGGSGRIDATLVADGEQPRIYTATQQRLFPDPAGSDRCRRITVAADIAGFDGQRRWHDHHLPGATAQATIHDAQLDEVWRSIGGFLRVGDVLRLRFRADNPAEQADAYGLYRDELRLEIRRGTRLWTFLLHVTVRPAAHRMVTAPARR